MLSALGHASYSLGAVFAIKTGYGAIVSTIVTPIALRAVLREREGSSQCG
jgi:hypothetical protein